MRPRALAASLLLPPALVLVAAGAPVAAQLGPIGTQSWNLASPGVAGPAQEGALAGTALAAGDFNCDGFEDLAVGLPLHDVDILTNAGALLVLYGSEAGLTATGSQFFDQLEPDLPDVPEEHDGFASALAAGDFNGDGSADLAIGVSFEDLGPLTDSGLLHVLHRAPGTGLSNAGDQIWLQTIDPSEDGDRFGFALATGRFAGHTGLDLAIGVPAETIGSAEGAGAFNVLYSAALFHDGFESGDTSSWTTTVE